MNEEDPQRDRATPAARAEKEDEDLLEADAVNEEEERMPCALENMLTELEESGGARVHPRRRQPTERIH